METKMLDAEKLQEMKDKHIISEEEFVQQKHRLAARIIRKEEKKSAKNGIVYVVLAFFLGAVGVHNFYARYWKRGFIQFLLALISPFMMFVPLLFTSVWALLELLFVNRGPDGVLFRGNRKVIWLLRAASVLVLAWLASSPDMMVHDINFELVEEF